MLQKRYRLQRSADVTRVRQQGHSWRHPLAILLTKSNAQDVSRFGFLASRRVGGAVARNRAKRLLREVIRLNLAGIEPGWDCVLIARSETPLASYVEMETAVLHLLLRAGLMKLPYTTE